MRKLLKIVFIVLIVAAIAEHFLDSTNDVSDFIVNEEDKQTSIVDEEKNQNKVYTVSSEDIFKSKKERFVAHRGFSDHAPENSISAFERAGKAGFWGIETDIVESADPRPHHQRQRKAL